MLLKQSAVRVALAILRGLVVLRRGGAAFGGIFLGPWFRLGRWLARRATITSYHAVYAIRKYTGAPSGTGQRRWVYVFSHPFIAHAIILVVVGIVVGGNLSASSVRAEGFGERSILFGLVNRLEGDILPMVIEEVTADSKSLRAPINYFGSGLVVGNLGIDAHSIDDNYVTTTVGGAVIAPIISGNRPSVAPRTEVETYVVASGDTLGSIAERFGISINTILWANGLSFRSTLRIGQTLTVLPVDGVLHKVKKGDTLGKIAKKYSVDADTILAFNHLASANDLAVGETFVVPGGKIVVAPVVRSVASVGSLFGTPSRDASARALPAGTGRWVWPSDLRYLTQYFTWRHTGIDIDCNGHKSSTNSNYAAADGSVIYSGWRRGYGTTVEIDHGNGIVTRYGHNEKNYVKVGQVVTAGTPIALCGNTGRSTGTHLHFEVIVGGRFKNPLEYLR